MGIISTRPLSNVMRSFAGFAVALLLVTATPSTAADRPCTDDEEATADAELASYDAAGPAGNRRRTASLAMHLPWGAPGPTRNTASEETLYQRDYLFRYHYGLRVPLWSAERLDASRLLGGRIRCFRPDPRLSAEQASTPDDYEERIYDQGHLTPNSDQSASDTSIINSFIQSNMVPQTCQFNRGIWQMLEGLGRRWAMAHATIYLINGSVFDRDNDGRPDPESAATRMQSLNGDARVAVPSAFYKVIARQRSDGTVETLTIMLPHNNTRLSGPRARAYLQRHITSLATVERASGLDFFPNGTAVVESTTLWPFPGSMPRNLCG